MKLFVILCTLGFSLATFHNEDIFSDEFIASINAKNSTWTAHRNFPKTYNLNSIKILLGTRKSDSLLIPVVEDVDSDLPISLDAREKWPYCKSMHAIQDQGCCASSWAFGAVEAMSDRICIISQGKVQVEVSAECLLTCCLDLCGDGCQGGDPYWAWLYWVNYGLVSGGPYGSHQGCQPYLIPPYKHDPPCPTYQDTPECAYSCEPSYNRTMHQDRRIGKTFYQVSSNPKAMATEILRHGPVEAVIDIYADFIHYKSGVYQHVHGEQPVGSLAIKILGWGVENGVDYWLAANAWNTEWGDNGFFRIRRGVDECGVEDYVFGGIPAKPY